MIKYNNGGKDGEMYLKEIKMNYQFGIKISFRKKRGLVEKLL